MDFLCQQQEEQPKQTKHLLYLPAAYVKGMYYLLNKNGQIMHEMNVFWDLSSEQSHDGD